MLASFLLAAVLVHSDASLQDQVHFPPPGLLITFWPASSAKASPVPATRVAF